MIAAAREGHLSTVKWIVDNGGDFSRTALHLAGEAGQYHILDWFKEAGFGRAQDVKAEAAARRGDREVLEEILKEKRVSTVRPSIFWAAVENGNLETLEWLLENYGEGLSFDELEDAINKAAKAGHVHVLNWLQEQGTLILSSSVVSYAASAGRINVLEWAESEGIFGQSSTACEMAAEGNHFETLKWLRGRGCGWDEGTFASAASSGNLEMLKWMKEEGCPWDSSVCSVAAFNQNHELLKWLRENGCPWDESTCANACRNNKILKWCRTNNCPWDARTCATAAELGNFKMLKWCRENGCPWNFSCISQDREILEWCRERNCPWNKETISLAAKRKPVSVIKFLHESGIPWDERATLNAAIFDNWSVFKYLMENGCPIDARTMPRLTAAADPRLQEWHQKFLQKQKVHTKQNLKNGRRINVTKIAKRSSLLSEVPDKKNLPELVENTSSLPTVDAKEDSNISKIHVQASNTKDPDLQGEIPGTTNHNFFAAKLVIPSLCLIVAFFAMYLLDFY